MKKQFYRVKQFADQTFSRSGKAEALSDELQLADRKVDHLRNALQLVSKRLSTGAGSTQGQDPAAREKRLKKLPEYLLGLSMCEASTYDDDDSILKYILYECGKTEKCLANEIAEHELEVERLVCAPLSTISEQDLPAIVKAKKHLSRVIAEKESAANKYNHLERQIEQNPTKLTSARDELEEASGRVDAAQDALAAELFALVAKEAQLAHTLLQYVKLQRAHHEAALKALEEAVPELELFINNSAIKPVFGYPLEEHLRVNGRTIALPIELCVCVLHELGLNEEGVFRIAGSASKVRRMKLSLDAGVFRVPLPREYRDLHVVAAVLKSYLRDLPEPLLTHARHDAFVAASKQNNEQSRLLALWDAVHSLPKHNFDNLRYLLKFLTTLTKNHAKNKMTAANLAIVIAPNLLWARDDVDMHVVAAITSVVELLIKHADWFFKEDVDFFVTFTRDDLFPDDYGFAPGFGIIPENANGDYSSMSRSVCEVDGSGHSRSNSHDTSLILLDNHMKKAQSNSSLSDQSSPPHGSPKPITRRKNKPLAPVPPAHPPLADKNRNLDPQPEVSPRIDSEKPAKPPRPVVPEVNRIVSGVQTINRSTYRQSKAEKFGSKENLCERRQSLEFEKDNQNNKSDSPPSSLVVKSVTSQSGTAARCRVGEIRPVAAPRSVLPVVAGPAVEEDVLLRGKPAVPERPATLRPHSFRGNDAAPVTLERTHVYSVDKQHPTVIQRTHSSGGDPCEPRALSRQLSQSDGSIPEAPASPRVRPPQRPQVPAPPPPAHPPAVTSESTDL